MGLKVSDEEYARWQRAGLVPAEATKASAPTAVADTRAPKPAAVTANRKPTTIATDLPRRLVVEFDVPARASSEANIGGSVRAKVARKMAMKAAARAALPVGLVVPLPCRVTLIRLGTRAMDSDNNAIAMKACRDVVSEWLGLKDDSDPRVRWRYRQRPSWTAGVRIRVETSR